jgi:hypothetical protein
MKWSQILLIIGMVVLAVGAIMSEKNIHPYANYVLAAGAVIMVFRGAVRHRERDN